MLKGGAVYMIRKKINTLYFRYDYTKRKEIQGRKHNPMNFKKFLGALQNTEL